VTGPLFCLKRKVLYHQCRQRHIARVTTIDTQNDSPAAIARDVVAIGRISAVPSMLRVICKNTGLGFAAVARVTEGTWTACAVQDDIQFGLAPCGQLDVNTTLCIEARAARQPVVIDHASADPMYCRHHTPRIYNIESYISVPIVLSNGDYFGNLCAIDPRPHVVSDPRTLTMFTLFAELSALQLESDARHQVAESALLTERATSDLREQFIAALGHDLRNPLAAVSASAELLSRRADDPTLVTLGGGLGLGLYICSQIVKAHGGRLEVSSSAEDGTRFTARLPTGPTR
jgi:GAF domain-containing protein